ncbi:L10-interacting MYB domain-containing protein-like isoform X2 [Durio zibethinus]|uniref:L10-interacting MYB domain-containing protein-like isoform X2 n=1 Tax=Durio zibethinus TaxID=66656 RepID=A0A6P5XW02_DURZI|nr:L10-interacting MYB domain-containing protein-like isoform X2 [Durio zibethinus]
MIIADDSVWTNYVKAHPDARIFSGRVIIENYDNLCTIFGNNNEVAEAVDISPVQNGGKVKDQAKNMRWTYEMDQCLSKVLAEQVKLGNKSKLDNKLRPAASVAADSALNERFQLDLTREHVRNHLKTWKKHYEILKGLLHHSDFEWDKAHTMIIANDSAWNQYIKRNPDARSFRGQVIGNYNELCAIFGCDDLPGGLLNSTNDDVNLTANNEAADTEFYNQSDVAKDKGKYILWTDEMDRCLTEQLVEQVTLGNKLQKSFKPMAFRAALSVLNKKFSLELTTENIRNRLRTWKKQYRLVKELLSQQGFEWDERQKMVITNDSDWREGIKTLIILTIQGDIKEEA